MERLFLLNVGVAVAPGEGDQVNLMIGDPTTQREIIIPLDPASAQTIGKALLAPRVAQPPTGGNLVLPR
jgi:hypothetical protein